MLPFLGSVINFPIPSSEIYDQQVEYFYYGLYILEFIFADHFLPQFFPKLGMLLYFSTIKVNYNAWCCYNFSHLNTSEFGFQYISVHLLIIFILLPYVLPFDRHSLAWVICFL